MSIKVLVLDKTTAVERLVRETLVALGCQIIPVSSAALAVFLARKNYPSLVICGLSSGYEELELARDIKCDPELAHIPVVIVTDQTDPDVERLCKDVGAERCLYAPIAPERFVWELREFLVAQEDDRPEESPE